MYKTHIRGNFMQKLKQFLINGIILTLTSLLMSSIGVWFSVYISNRIGSEAMGVYQLAMSVYSFAITLATSGINLAATRLVSEEIGEDKMGGVKKSVLRCVIYALTCSVTTALLLFGFSNFIAQNWLKNTSTAVSLKAMAISLPFLALSSVLSGYFTAVRRVYKNAAVQIIEQFFKIGVTIFALSLVPKNSLMYTCLAIVVSGVASDIIAFFVCAVIYFLDAKQFKNKTHYSKNLTKRMNAIAIPIALSSYMRSGLLTLKNLLVPLQLQKFGLTQAKAVSTFGMLHGVVLPILLFPSALISSFSSLLIPELSEYRAKNQNILNSTRLNYVINKTLDINLIFSILVAGVMVTFATPLANAVSRESGSAFYIRLLAPIIPIMYVDNCIDCMLKGLNEQVSSMRYNIIDAFVSLVLVTFLLPVTGIKGYVAVICNSEILNFALSLNRLVKVTQFRLDTFEVLIKPLFAIFVSTLLATAVFNNVTSTISLTLAIIFTVFSYILILYALKGKKLFSLSK